MEDYILGGQKPEGLIDSAARIAGERITIANARARENATEYNPYRGNVPYPANLPDPELYKSDLGTPVYADVTFGLKMSNGSLQEIPTGGYAWIPNNVFWTDTQGGVHYVPFLSLQAVLIDVTFPRNIVKTVIQGRKGTVKEYIGEGDAQINFRGVITGTNGHYPIETVEILKKIIEAPIPIPISCTYLNNLGIDTIVFEDRTLNQQEGGYSYQQFNLNAVQDTPQELLIGGI